MSEHNNTEVISYKLDTKDFDKGMDRVIEALEKVEKREYLTNLQNVVNGIGNSLEDVSFANIENGITSLESNFSTLGVVSMSVINNMTTAAMNFAQKFVFDKVLGDAINGFQELNLQINATQTILANTGDRFGTTLEQVNQGLDGLNQYADKTIYNFSEMTMAVGAFTSAGIDLGNSVQAIRGIANMAAYAGASSQAASTGMYQFSNALSMGYMMLYQWNSLVYSGLGTKQLEQELISSARGLGINIDAILKEYGGSFRYSLEAGWADTKVLMHTIAKYSGEVTEDQLRAMKYTEEEITRIMKLGKTAEDSATKVISYEKLITSLNESVGSGWARTFRLLVGDFEQGKSLFSMISDQLLKVINRSAENRNYLVETWSKLGGRDLVVTAIEKLLSTYNKLLLTVGGALNQVIPPLTPLTLVKITRAITNLIDQLTPTAKGLDQISRIARGFFSALDIPLQFFKALFRYLSGLIKPLLNFKLTWKETLVSAADYITALRKELIKGDFFYKKIVSWGESVTAFVNKVKKLADDLKKTKFAQEFTKFIDGILLKVGIKDKDAIVKFILKARDSIKELFKTFDSKNALASVGKFFTILVDYGKRIYRFLEPVVLYIIELVKDFARVFASAIDDLANNFTFEKLEKVLGLLGKFLLLRSLSVTFQDFSFVMEIFMSMGMGFAKTLDTIWKALKQFGVLNDAEVLMSTAIAIGILSASVFMLASIPEEDLARGIGAVTMIYGIMAGSLSAMKNVLSAVSGFTDLLLLPGVLIGTALSIVILADALLKFKDVPFKEIIKGFVGIIGILTIFGVFLKLQGKNGPLSLSTSLGFLALAFSIRVLATSIKFFGEVDYKNIGKAVVAVGSIMLLVGALSKSGAVGPKLLILATTITGIAASLVVLGLAFKFIGTLDLNLLMNGMMNLVAMIGSLYVVLMVTDMFSPAAIAKTAIMTLVVAALVGAFKLVTMLDPAKIILGSSAIAIGIGALALVTSLLKPSLLTSIGILALLSGAIGLFALSLLPFNNVDFKQVLLGGIALTAFTAAVLLVGTVITPILGPVAAFAGVLILLSTSMALFGVGVLGLGTGIRMLAEAMNIYVTVGGKFLDIFIQSLPKLSIAFMEFFKSLTTTMVQLIPQFTTIGTVFLVSMAKGTIDAAPIMIRALVTVISGLLDGLIVLAPKLGYLLFILFRDALMYFDNNIGTFTTQFINIQVKFINGLSRGIGPLVASLFNFMIAVVRATRKQVDEKGAAIRIELAKLALSIIKFFVDGMYDGTEVIEKGLEYFAAYVHSEAGRKFYERRDKVIEIGLNFVKGLIYGLSGKAAFDLLKTGVEAVTDYIKNKTRGDLRIESPSKEGEDIGELYTTGVAKGIKPELIRSKLDVLKDALLEFMNGPVLSEVTLSPVISPILDSSAMSEISKRLSSVFSTPTYNPGLMNGMLPATAQAGTTYNYEQTIISSQPLSLEEIARRSKSLVSRRAANDSVSYNH